MSTLWRNSFRRGGWRMTFAETVELGPGDTGLCMPCVEGVCHWEGSWWHLLAGPMRPACSCPRHRVSAYARGFCLAFAPRGTFPFEAVCRRTKGHVTPGHCDTWREVVW